MNLLKTHCGVPVIDGPGETWQCRRPDCGVTATNALDVSQDLLEKKQNWTTSSPLFPSQRDLSGGTHIADVYLPDQVDGKSSVENAMMQRQKEKESKEKNIGIKHDQNKPAMALLSPEGLIQEALAMTYGANKYGNYNWRNGITVTRYLSAALRHITSFIDGESLDKESGLNHLGHARANLGMALQTLKDQPELNDIYKREKE